MYIKLILDEIVATVAFVEEIWEQAFGKIQFVNCSWPIFRTNKPEQNIPPKKVNW